MNTVEKLKQFCATEVDEDRKKCLLKPFYLDGYTYAANEYCIVRIHGNHVESENRSKHPAVNNFFCGNSESALKFENRGFQKFLRTHQEQVIKYQLCEVCNGTGKVDWKFESYKKEHECPVCEGTGEDHNKDGELVLEYKTAAFLLELLPKHFVSLNYIDKIAKLSDSIEFFHLEEDHPNMFRIVAGEFEVSVMGVKVNPDDLDTYLNYGGAIPYEKLEAAALVKELAC